MAKKFVRGITDIKTISNQDFDTNNVNDLLSDGEHNYIHRKKGNSEEYHNLTNNLKTVTSDNTDLLTVTNDNDTSNSATLHPQHDATKEQAIESTRNTITIEHAENGTVGTTKVDTNPAKVLEHDNLIVGANLTKEHSEGGNTTTLKVSDEFTQRVTSAENNITDLQNNKQNKIQNNASIGIAGTSLRQLYALKQNYNAAGGLLKTHVKSLSVNTSINVADEEFNFIVKLDKNVSSVNFTLNSHDTTKFSNIISAYGENNTVRVSGCVFTLSESTLTVTTANNTEQNYVITFSDII